MKIRWGKLPPKANSKNIYELNLFYQSPGVMLPWMKKLIQVFQNSRNAREIGLIKKIADYMLVNQTKLKKGVDDAMGGQVLELESERLMKLGSIKTLLKLNYSADEISKILDEPIEKVTL